MGAKVQYEKQFPLLIPREDFKFVIKFDRSLQKPWRLCSEELPFFTKLKMTHSSEKDMEILKFTMIKHEQIFKEQVRELHRLYHIQKILMTELRIRDSSTSTLTSASLSDCPFPRHRGPDSLKWEVENMLFSALDFPAVSNGYRNQHTPVMASPLFDKSSPSRSSLSELTQNLKNAHKGKLTQVIDLEKPVEECSWDEGVHSVKEEVKRRPFEDVIDLETDLQLTLRRGNGEDKKVGSCMKIGLPHGRTNGTEETSSPYHEKLCPGHHDFFTSETATDESTLKKISRLPFRGFWNDSSAREQNHKDADRQYESRIMISSEDKKTRNASSCEEKLSSCSPQQHTLFGVALPKGSSVIATPPTPPRGTNGQLHFTGLWDKPADNGPFCHQRSSPRDNGIDMDLLKQNHQIKSRHLSEIGATSFVNKINFIQPLCSPYQNGSNSKDSGLDHSSFLHSGTLSNSVTDMCRRNVCEPGIKQQENLRDCRRISSNGFSPDSKDRFRNKAESTVDLRLGLSSAVTTEADNVGNLRSQKGWQGCSVYNEKLDGSSNDVQLAQEAQKKTVFNGFKFTEFLEPLSEKPEEDGGRDGSDVERNFLNKLEDHNSWVRKASFTDLQQLWDTNKIKRESMDQGGKHSPVHFATRHCMPGDVKVETFKENIDAVYSPQKKQSVPNVGNKLCLVEEKSSVHERDSSSNGFKADSSCSQENRTQELQAPISEKLAAVEAHSTSDPASHQEGSGHRTISSNEQQTSTGHKTISSNEEQTSNGSSDAQKDPSTGEASVPAKSEQETEKIDCNKKLQPRETASECGSPETEVAANALLGLGSERASERAVTELDSSSCNSASDASAAHVLNWFANTIVGGTQSQDEVSGTRHGLDYFECMTLMLQETPTSDTEKDKAVVPDQCAKQSPEDADAVAGAGTGGGPRRTCRRTKRQRDFQREILPSISCLSRQEISEDMQVLFRPPTGHANGRRRKHEHEHEYVQPCEWFLGRRSRNSATAIANMIFPKKHKKQKQKEKQMMIMQQQQQQQQQQLSKCSSSSWGDKVRRPRMQRPPRPMNHHPPV